MPLDDPSRCQRLYFRVPLEQIAYVRFIVESYEGLAQVTSLPGRCEMEWIVPASLAPVAESLAGSLALEAQLVRIEPPGDWPTTSAVV